MTPDRWRQVADLFQAAAERPPGERRAFLEGACGDESLRAEVDALLAHDAEDPLLDSPVGAFVGSSDGGPALAQPPLRTGGQLGPYKILEPLGAGGMGAVYRAWDASLRRELALKVLPVGANWDHLRRFPVEARLASGLNHPNIVVIYELGKDGDIAYIAMELVRGRPLRAELSDGALCVERAINLGIQIADALAAAHSGGVIHRDLKPENIMITPDERVKVLDFGLAKQWVGAIPTGAETVEPHTETRLTFAGTILGTIGYMAPEQAAGKPAGPAADQFSFGAILYEMLSGRRAFKGETPLETLSAILRDEPPSLRTLNSDIRPPLLHVVERCLRKAPGDRYPGAADVAKALRETQERLNSPQSPMPTWPSEGSVPSPPLSITRRTAIRAGGLAAGGVVAGILAWKYQQLHSGVRSLAVYPFENTARDENTEFLCDGLRRDLIRQLASIPSLTIKRGMDSNLSDPQDVGRRLKVDAILTGSVLRRPPRILVRIDLIDTKTGGVMWSSPVFDRDEKELLRTQEDLVRQIVDEAIRVSVNGPERRRLERRSTNNAEAMQLYMRAVYHHARETEADYLAARVLLLEALEKDRSFALAYWQLASNYTTMAMDGYARSSEVWPVAKGYALEALALDPASPEPHVVLGMEALSNRWNRADAERELQLGLESREPDVWMPYALECWAVGRNEEALRIARKALESEPASIVWRLKVGDLLLQTGQLEAAVKVYEGILADAHTDPRAYFALAEARSAQQRFDDAIVQLRQGYAALGAVEPGIVSALSAAHGSGGYLDIQRAGARLELDQLADRAVANKYASPLDYARAHARLGNREESFRYLEAAAADRSPGLLFLRVDHAWDALRKDRRFRDAIERVGLG